MPEGVLVQLKEMGMATGRYYRLVAGEALRATVSHANKQGVLVALLLSVLASFIYAVWEDNVNAGPLVGATIASALLVGMAWFALQLVLTPVRIHSAQRARITELERTPEITARFTSPRRHIVQLAIDYLQPNDISDTLINATVPLAVAHFYPCTREGRPTHTGKTTREEDGDYWLWVYEGDRFRSGTTFRYWFWIVIPEDTRAGDLYFTLIHQDLPQGYWRTSISLDDSEIAGALRKANQ